LERPSKKKFNHTLLVDGDALIKTAYHGASNLYYKDTHIGGLFQFFSLLRKVITTNRFDKVFIFWDGPFSGRLRHEIYNEYKANRDKDFYNVTEPKDLSLFLQKERVKAYAEELFIRQYEDEVCEADDCIGYYCSQIKDDEKVVILTNDRDMCQLIDDRVAIYILNKRTIVSKYNYGEYFDHHQSNSALIKIITGDSSDNIKGVKGVKEKTLLKYFPELSEKKLTLGEIFIKINGIQNDRKTRLKTLDNILNGVTTGVQGERLYEINERIINLTDPIMTENCKDNVDNIIESPIDPEDRNTKNVLSMMIEDGFVMAIPGGRDGYIEYLRPFLSIIKKEKKYFKQVN
jgi:5'-3' exonuclease|tara:strand:- start:1607 stop:2644 length:1038 start_codon:yes stop_codon:yes gene_type:complete